MQAIWREQVIADSKTTIEVDGYHYFPRAAVRMDLLTPAPKSASDQQCPHGVQFYDVGKGAGRSQRSAWSYEKPGKAMAKVDQWIGFWDEVELRA
jgi:uncharacterized protein (DUF427 family)